MGTEGEQYIRRTLAEGDYARRQSSTAQGPGTVKLVKSSHPLPPGIKGYFPNPGISLLIIHCQSGLGGQHYQRTLCGITDDPVAIGAGIQPGIIGQGKPVQEDTEMVILQWFLLCFTLLKPKLTGGLISLPGDLQHAAVDVYMGNRHLILGQSAGLVRGDDSSCTQGFHSWKLPDDSPAPGHPLYTQGQYDGDYGRQPFGNGGHS